MEKQYILTVFSENKVGILNQITTVLTCRNVNIESLTTSESAVAGIHRFTIVVNTDPEKVEKMVRQIEKRVEVLKAFVHTPDEVVQQEIALYKVSRNRNVENLVREHHVRILEIGDDYIVLEKNRPYERNAGAVGASASLWGSSVRAHGFGGHRQGQGLPAGRVPRHRRIQERTGSIKKRTRNEIKHRIINQKTLQPWQK